MWCLYSNNTFFVTLDVLNKQTILNLLRDAKPILEKKYRIKALALFGSYSRNDAITGSDIDLLVDLDRSIGIEFIDLANELEILLHNKVDLVSLNGIKPKYFSAIKPDFIYV